MRRLVLLLCLETAACSTPTSVDLPSSASTSTSPAATSSSSISAAGKISGAPVPLSLHLGATASHACFVSTRKNLFCWGRNDDGQLGQGDTLPSRPQPVQWKVGAAVESAALGAKHTCALFADGRVRCVGVDASGPRSADVPIEGLDQVQSIVAGGDFTCALSRDESVRCWGRVPGQKTVARNPELLAGLVATSLTASTGTLCATTHAGVVCVGDNAGGTTLIGGPTTLETPTAIPYATDASQLALSDLGLCAFRKGSGQCWSDNVDRPSIDLWSADELASGADGLVCVLRSAGLACERLPRGEWLAWRMQGEFRALGVGRAFACALPSMSHDGPTCWGDNAWGQVGARAPTARLEAIKLDALQGATRIAAGTTSLCALMPDKKMRCLGTNGKTEEHWNANGMTTEALGDDLANTITRVDDMAVGGAIHCALTDRLPTCWGDNRSSQIITVNPGIIDQPSTFASLGNLKRLVIGPSHACSLDVDDKVRCWGGEGKERKTPIEVTGLVKVLDIAVGGDRGCALHEDGTVSCFSLRGEHAFEARKVEGAKGLVSIAAGARHVCGVTSHAEVSCFGANDAGQLGRPPDAKDGERAQIVSKLEHVKQVTLGETFTCALVEDGTVHCFGSASDGELARADKTPTGEPVQIPGVVRVVQIAASAHAVSARLANGGVVAWGGRTFFAKVGDDLERSENGHLVDTSSLIEESP